MAPWIKKWIGKLLIKKWIERGETLRRPLRTLIFLGVGAFILFAPLPHQVFKTKTHGLPRWRMFGGMSLQECAGVFEQVTISLEQGKGGKRQPLDRLALLGFSKKKPPRRRDRSIKNVKQARAVGQKICKKIGPNADVRLTMRCPSFKTGWVVKARGEKNLCAPTAKKVGGATLPAAQAAKRSRSHLVSPPRRSPPPSAVPASTPP